MTPSSENLHVASSVKNFISTLDFALDAFQFEGCAALGAGHAVLVCAPTGAGKTVIGECAVYLALNSGKKCFYTTPIKALSNQKYSELSKKYGAENVGLLTGDTSLNSSAPIVVMTTEVLRNMLYANSTTLEGLSHVVMDEVHYLADRFRGAVWEEVILHLDPEVKLVSLSATVSNAEEFGDWLDTVRGDTQIIVSEHRPIPLFQHMLVGTKLFDLFDPHTLNQERKPEINSTLTRYLRQRELLSRGSDVDEVLIRRGRGGHLSDRRRVERPRSYAPSRPDIAKRLEREGLLPAITFIFSRAGCDGALNQCLRSGIDLLTPTEAALVDTIVERYLVDISPDDQLVLDVESWRRALSLGFAAHHAGMLPIFRHCVEELFVKGLVRMVFATETLALGINMPARSVVLERLVKYNGESHVDLTPGEYTQLTGRAGRRGIDIEGHAIVLHNGDRPPAQVAGLAGARTYPLRSSFAPEYNMAVNLIGRVGLLGSRELLKRSFAQFQADKSVVGQYRQIDTAGRVLAKINHQLSVEAQQRNIELGVVDSFDGFLGYMKLREAIRIVERETKFTHRIARGNAIAEDLTSLKPGHIIGLYLKHRGIAVVLESANNNDDPRPLVLTESGWAGRVGIQDFLNPPVVLGNMRIPKNADRRSGTGRKQLADSLRQSGINLPRKKNIKSITKQDDSELKRLRNQLRQHPVHQLTHHDQLFRLAEKRTRAIRDIENLENAVATKTSTLADRFDALVNVLTELGYLTVTDSAAELTDKGRMLSRIYSESDVLICEIIRDNLWDNLTPAELAAVVSSMVYTSRRDSFSGVDLTIGNSAVLSALSATITRWRVLARIEAENHLAPTREPDAGFALATLLWAQGRTLSEVLTAAGERGKPLPAGDFVRWTRMVCDLLEQLRNRSESSPLLISSASSAIKLLRRGVVAAEID